jgi:hypothetical protein
LVGNNKKRKRKRRLFYIYLYLVFNLRPVKTSFSFKKSD